MPSVGTMLREARLAQGVSLQDISARTRIILKNLEAIESDNLAAFSSPFIYRSFVKQFGEQVKLDWSTVAPAVQSASGIMPQPRVPGEEDVSSVRVPRLKPHVRRDFRWIVPTASMIAVIAICSGSYAAWRNFGANGVALLSRYVPSIPKPATRTVEVAPPSATARSAAAETDSGIHILLSAIEPSWLSIVADGKQTYSGILEASETKSLDGRETARVRTGNAGGVSVVFNGKSLGPMGRRGQTRTLVFTTTGYEVVQPTAQVLRPAIFVPARFSPTGE